MPEAVAEENWWEVLGVGSMTIREAIKEAYFRKAKIFHPDAGGNAEQFNRINKAYQKALQILK